MHVLSTKLTFSIQGAVSLKDKRQVRRSLIEKVRNRFNVSISEVDMQDVHQTLVIGVAVVSGEKTHAKSSLDEIIRFMENNPNAELVAITEYEQGNDNDRTNRKIQYS